MDLAMENVFENILHDLEDCILDPALFWFINLSHFIKS